MKQSIPSRVCDRCGGVYQLADKSKVRGKSFSAKLIWEPPPGDPSLPIKVKVLFGDLCPACAKYIGQFLAQLDPRLQSDPPGAKQPAGEEGKE